LARRREGDRQDARRRRPEAPDRRDHRGARRQAPGERELMAVAHRVYAEALLEAAQEKKRLDEVRKQFDEFAAAVEGSDDLRAFLRNPQLEAEAKRGTLEDLLEGADALFLNFIRLL